ncbi:type I-E CRISPR-associated protein Cse1/CasA [Corynebacterium ulceribovis]|uniref:type I-E CRISPR-associated protein Cse1/CasA n=1 Tax=Corynebacterium ulceribovis TaxID=487732 RepID=UPI00047832E6|nr:type I-E CRISPR-associated protein Cse1/CasA [Corynebacterium ulceribovis]
MFSLVDDPWILVVDTDGHQRLVGIRQLFSGDVSAMAIQGDSPAQNYAILRLLLAIFWRAHAPESKVRAGRTFSFSDWFERTRKRLQTTGRDEAVLQYLAEYEDRFELIDSPTPFMQVPGLHVKSGEVKHITTIVPEAQEDYFSMRAGQPRDTLEFAEAARWLIYAQAFDYSGIKSGLVGDSRVKGGKGYPIGTGWTGMTGGTVVVGDTLLDTLVLNTTIDALINPGDRPVWERTPDGSDSRAAVGEPPGPQGPADLATWQSRRIRLHVNEGRVTGVVLGNGDKIPEAGANVLDDPMTPYRYSANKSKKGRTVYYPRPYDTQRTMWKALEPLIVAETDGGFSGKEKAPKRPMNLDNLANLSDEVDGIPQVLNIDLVSVEYGNQASSVATTFAAQMNMPTILLMRQSAPLRAVVRDAAAQTTKGAVSLGQFAGNLLVAAGDDYLFRPEPTDRALAELEPQFNTWLESLAALPVSAARAEHELTKPFIEQWQQTARQLIDEHARILLRGAGPKSFVGRTLESGGENSNSQFVSAASYYQLLQRSLDKVLPLTAKQRDKANEGERKEGKE